MRVFLMAFLLSVVGCGDAEYADSAERKEQAAQRDTVFDPMIETMDRAKRVDELSANRMGQLDRDIERSE